jgi:hypothetical protein
MLIRDPVKTVVAQLAGKSNYPMPKSLGEKSAYGRITNTVLPNFTVPAVRRLW